MLTRGSLRSATSNPGNLERNDQNFPALVQEGGLRYLKRKATVEHEPVELPTGFESEEDLDTNALGEARMGLPDATPSTRFRGRGGARMSGGRSSGRGRGTATPPPRYAGTPGFHRSEGAVTAGSHDSRILEEKDHENEFDDHFEDEESFDERSATDENMNRDVGIHEEMGNLVQQRAFFQWQQRQREQQSQDNDFESRASMSESESGRGRPAPTNQHFTETENAILRVVSQQGSTMEKLLGVFIKGNDITHEKKLKVESSYRAKESLVNRLLWLTEIVTKREQDGEYKGCVKAILGGPDDASSFFKSFLPPSVEAASNRHCEMHEWNDICLNALFAYVGGVTNTNKSPRRQVSEFLEQALSFPNYKKEVMEGTKAELKEGAENKDALRVMHSKLTTLQMAVNKIWTELQLPQERQPDDSEFVNLFLDLVGHFRIIDQSTVTSVRLMGGGPNTNLRSVCDNLAKVVHGSNFTRNPQSTPFRTPTRENKSRRQSGSGGYRRDRGEIPARSYQSSEYRRSDSRRTRDSDSRRTRDDTREYPEVSARAYRADPRNSFSNGRGTDRKEGFSDKKGRTADDRRRSSSSYSKSLNY